VLGVKKAQHAVTGVGVAGSFGAHREGFEQLDEIIQIGADLSEGRIQPIGAREACNVDGQDAQGDRPVRATPHRHGTPPSALASRKGEVSPKRLLKIETRWIG